MAQTALQAQSFNAPAALSGPRSTLPHLALASLPRLYAEAGANLALNRFLASGPAACVTLMTGGAVALLLTGLAGGGTLKADFTWAVLLLIGIVALIRNHIRGFARSLRRVPLEEAASDQRALLLYTGGAWGAGGFLVMPALPHPLLVLGFALLPGLALGRIVKDAKGLGLFVVSSAPPLAIAALMGDWPRNFEVSTVIVLGASLMLAFAALQHGRKPDLPEWIPG